MVPQMLHFSLGFLVRSEPDGLKPAGLCRGYVSSQGGMFPALPYWDTSHDRQWKWKKQTSLSWILFKEFPPPATNRLSFWERMSGIENYHGHKMPWNDASMDFCFDRRCTVLRWWFLVVDVGGLIFVRMCVSGDKHLKRVWKGEICDEKPRVIPSLKLI